MSDCSTHAFDVPLKPCPFCCGEAELKRYQSGDWQVICYHADGCIMLESDLDNCYWENVQTLVRQWNSRAERTCEFKPFRGPISDTDEIGDSKGVCSVCSAYMHEQYNYCPNCGARVVE